MEKVTELFAKIYHFDEKVVCMDVNIGGDEENGFVFEAREFQREILFDDIKVERGVFIKLKVTQQPGSSTIEIIQVDEDLNHMFPPVDFGELKDSDIFFGSDETKPEDFSF